MRTAFDAIASSYVQEDAHWGCDLDVLTSALRAVKSTPPRYLDLGCGPGFHLGMLGQVYPKAELVGVDSSPRMLEEARRNLDQWGVRNVALVRSDIIGYTANRTYDVISCLNNTFNNLYEFGDPPTESRKKALGFMRSLLCEDGRVVMSVYNLEKLDLTTYGERLFVLPASDTERGDLFVEYRPVDGPAVRYYSHWSTYAEAGALFEQSGFKIELLERRMARIVAMARAV